MSNTVNETAGSDDPIVAVMKIGATGHMTELLSDGHVFMNPASYFRRLEDGTGRSDPHEGAAYCTQADGATFSVKEEGEFRDLGTIVGPIVHLSDEFARANIFCLHALRQSDWNRPLNMDPLGLGDAVIVFLDFNEFVRRLTQKVEEAGHRLHWAAVTYVDRASYTGEMGPFRKFSEHAAQRELRIVVVPGTGEPRSFRLGNLSDIALMVPTHKQFMFRPFKRTP